MRPLLQEAAGRGPALVQFLRAVRYAALRRRVLGGPPLSRDTVAQTLGDQQVSGHIIYSDSLPVAMLRFL